MSTQKRREVFFLILLALVASGTLAGAQTAYHTLLLNSYQKAQCRTINEQVYTTTANRSASIAIDVTYDLTTASGKHITGMDTLSTSDFNEAEDLKNEYQVGSTFDCWYSALSPTHTTIFLPLAPYLMPLISLCIDVFVFGALFFQLYMFIYLPLHLSRKGVKTQGTVIECERKSKRKTSLVAFQTLTDPPIEYRVLIPGKYRIQRRLPLIYDPKHPRERIRLDYKENDKALRIILILIGIEVSLYAGVLIMFALMGFFSM